MGLDMYLVRRHYVKDWDHTPKEKRNNAKLFIKGKTVSTKKLYYLEFEACYWRKANSIHKWFVDNIQNGVDNCASYAVGLHEIEKLKDLCLYVLKDKDKAEELLPVCSGFFFGDQKYGDNYFYDLNNTVEMIDNLLKNHTDHDEYAYTSSW